ncbi:hypothetical protein D3C76_674500 [compost metagenome]
MSYPKAAIETAFQLLPAKMDSMLARVNLAAIGFQESEYLVRIQYGNGPARSYWQFENGRLAGINGVLTHRASSDLAKAVCKARGVEPERMAVWKAMETDDVLGAAFARLLMYTDPLPLPDNAADAWEMYAKRLWRPGRPHPDKWPKSWAFGLERAK